MIRSIFILIALWVLLVAVGSMHTYGDIYTRNAGVWWQFGQHHCGYEFSGHPGFFCDVD